MLCAQQRARHRPEEPQEFGEKINRQAECWGINQKVQLRQGDEKQNRGQETSGCSGRWAVAVRTARGGRVAHDSTGIQRGGKSVQAGGLPGSRRRDSTHRGRKGARRTAPHGAPGRRWTPEASGSPPAPQRSCRPEENSEAEGSDRGHGRLTVDGAGAV